jgi:prolipoprotein diacylglyceryltransferase
MQCRVRHNLPVRCRSLLRPILLPAHPTQVYESLAGVVMLVLAVRRRKRVELSDSAPGL